MKINFPRRSPFFVLSSLFYLFFVRLSISEPSLDYNFIILGGNYEIWYSQIFMEKSFKARTTGKAKRKLKKALIPGYGKKGRGLLHPKKAVYNKIYNKTSFSFWDIFKRK